MGNKHTVSSQPRTTTSLTSDLFFISRSLNEPYNTQWQSKAIDMSSLAHSLAERIEATDYAGKFEQLNEIYYTYLNNDNLSISYDKSTQQIQLIGNDEVFSQFDASEFVTSGILENAKVQGEYLILTFNTGSKTKEVKINLSSFIDTYYPGNGICCQNRTFSIDEDVVSTVGHTHMSSDVTDLANVLANYAIVSHNHVSSEITDLNSLLTNYAAVNHNHTSSDITDLANTLENYSLKVHNHTSSDITDLANVLENYAAKTHNHSSSEITDLNDILANYCLTSNTSSAIELKNAFDDINSRSYLSVNALEDLSGNWQTAWERVQNAPDGLTANVGKFAYAETITTADVDGYKDTTYTAGTGLKLNGTQFSLTADVTSYENVKSNLSNDGYCVTFLDYPQS